MADTITGVIEAAKAIQANRMLLRALEHHATEAVEAGLYDRALKLIAGGADWAWYNHTGMFASRTFERLLAVIGSDVVAHIASDRRPAARRRVLHVFTQVYPTGGHTRLAWRWMEQDPSSEHSVVLTAQAGLPVPEKLVAACGGRLVAVGPCPPVERVTRVAQALVGYDLLALHIHPHDAVGVAALSGLGNRPRTLFVNHADHVFWLGLGATDQLVNPRPASDTIASSRRTGSREGFVRLVLPLDDPESAGPAGIDLRSMLGINASDPVLATIAHPYKYSSTTEPTFATLAREALAQVPAAHVVAVGPTPEDRGWEVLHRSFPTRVHLLGTTPEYFAVLQAANVYLDSFPFTSITSALEASLQGVPVVTMADEANGPLNFDDYGLTPEVVATPEEWIKTVASWCADLGATAGIGREMRAATLGEHSPAAWTRQLAAIYDDRGPFPGSLPVSGSTALEPYDGALLRLHEAGGISREFAELLAQHGVVIDNHGHLPA